jgi:hypothetical protein
VATITELVVGSTRKPIIITLVDENDVPINLTGATANPRLQGQSNEVALVDLDVVGAISDPAQGVVTFAEAGTFVTSANLTGAGTRRGVWTLRVKFWDAAGKFDFGPEFMVAWNQDPLV